MIHKQNKWLLIFYSVPSKPVNNRMQMWRRLSLSGAVQLKDAVYILPYSGEHHNFFKRIISDVLSLGGEGFFVSLDRIEGITNEEIKGLFNKEREKDYERLIGAIDKVELDLSNLLRGRSKGSSKKLTQSLERLIDEYHLIKKRDFFGCPASEAAKNKIDYIRERLIALKKEDDDDSHSNLKTLQIPYATIADYKGKVWVTRARPYVDRISSAWLIKRFIDTNAEFVFVSEEQVPFHDDRHIGFDIQGGKFSHVGDLCTFETLIRSFRIKAKGLKKIAQIIHDLDIKDNKYNIAEAAGIEAILMGLRSSSNDDHLILNKGIEIMDMLYTAVNS